MIKTNLRFTNKPTGQLGTPEERAAIRAIYEGTPGATRASVAAATGVPERILRKWQEADGGWARPCRARKEIPNLPGKVAEAVNKIKVKMSELGKPMSDEVALTEASKELAEEIAVDVRAQVLDRHRKEWAAPRNIAYDAMQKGDFERAKLAKISAETLSLIQSGECRAYGITADARTGDGSTVVVIERDGSTEV